MSDRDPSPPAQKFVRAAREGAGPADPSLPRPRAAHPLFELRWRRALREIEGPLHRLYAPAHDVDALLGRMRDLLYAHWRTRPQDLRALDLERDVDPEWFLSERMAGYVCYVDRFAGTFRDLPDRIPYLRTLGITYLHLMPCLLPRPGDSDGGYAVMDYTETDPRLGSMDDLEAAARVLRANGISLCIDLVLNHTAREHRWAEAARAGDPHYRAFYRLFEDDTLPRRYAETLPDIFPAQAPGSFTWEPTMGRWVWTTFNTFQWDLNWENPEVLIAFLDIIMTLANRGVEVFRLDAVAFLWKRLGTTCQNLPEVHDLLQVLVQATRAAAPAVIHKAEAIVGPRDLVAYLGQGQHEERVCQLAYHNSLMVQAWSSLAARDTRLMTHVLGRHFPERFRRATWVTYLRCHDDIGWAITDEDAAGIPDLSAPAHRAFLADFYNGSFPGSFARGEDFQPDPVTGDRRTNGTLASLAGLEVALESGEAGRIDDAVARILMLHALIAVHGGIPLVFMGDEIGLLNDPSFRSDPHLATDGRWLHRPRMDWVALEEGLSQPDSPAARIAAGLRTILAARAACPSLVGHVPTRVVDLGDRALFSVLRPHEAVPVLGLFNFTEHPALVPAGRLPIGTGPLHDRLWGGTVEAPEGRLDLPPYAARWLAPAG